MAHAQALKFQRYECMGFTYWARGLGPPDAAPGEDTGRLSFLQSMAHDLRSLVWGDVLPGGAVQAGPFDALLSSLHAQERSLSTPVAIKPYCACSSVRLICEGRACRYSPSTSSACAARSPR